MCFYLKTILKKKSTFVESVWMSWKVLYHQKKRKKLYRYDYLSMSYQCCLVFVRGVDLKAYMFLWLSKLTASLIAVSRLSALPSPFYYMYIDFPKPVLSYFFSSYSPPSIFFKMWKLFLHDYPSMWILIHLKAKFPSFRWSCLHGRIVFSKLLKNKNCPMPDSTFLWVFPNFCNII